METGAPSKITFEYGDESSSDEEENIESQLADVTFEDLQKAISDGSHSIHLKPKPEKKTGRANKNRPMEVSCNKPIGRFREVVQAPKKVIRDPRFESLCGNLDEEGFRKRYDFLFQKDLPAEREELRKQLKKSKDSKVINELKNRMSWIDKQIKSGSVKRTDAQILSEHKKKEREAAQQGKRPFYLKKCISPLFPDCFRLMIKLLPIKVLPEAGIFSSYIDSHPCSYIMGLALWEYNRVYSSASTQLVGGKARHLR